MNKIRVLVVDDSALMRRVISDIINRQPDMEVIATANNGEEALVKVRELKPDVVTMDVEMPKMDGIQALEAIMKSEPLPVIMLSSQTQAGAQATIKALQHGAIDFIPKPSGSISLDIHKVAEEIVSKVRVAAGAKGAAKKLALPSLPKVVRSEPQIKAVPVTGPLNKLVVIGTSTGGPKALHEVIPKLPSSLGAGVLVVQHMPPGFTKSLADRLDSLSSLKVKEAEDGDPVQPGHVYVAPGDFHMQVKRVDEGMTKKLKILLTKDPPVGGLRPCADVTMESAAREFWSDMVAVIMTGMGHDGARGAALVKGRGGKVIAEDPSTCIVYGMPKAVVESGNADKVVPLPRIAEEIVKSL